MRKEVVVNPTYQVIEVNGPSGCGKTTLGMNTLFINISAPAGTLYSRALARDNAAPELKWFEELNYTFQTLINGIATFCNYKPDCSSYMLINSA